MVISHEGLVESLWDLGLSSFLWSGMALETSVILKTPPEDQDSARFNPGKGYIHTCKSEGPPGNSVLVEVVFPYWRRVKKAQNGDISEH